MTFAPLNKPACFDAMYILGQLQPVAGGGTQGEVQVFAYLSCVLTLFHQKAPIDWGYRFAALPPALPYAVDLTEALDGLVAAQYAQPVSRSSYALTDQGQIEVQKWSRLYAFQERPAYLSAAVGASTFMSIPLVGAALRNDPQLVHADVLKRRVELFGDSPASDVLEQFIALREALGGRVESLLTPALVYLEYLTLNATDETVTTGA
jgi:hypothetical protein